jgi:hypothetical protein
MEQGVNLVEEYDRKFLYSMLVKCHEHLHLLKKSNVHIMLTKIFLIRIVVWTFLNKLQI